MAGLISFLLGSVPTLELAASLSLATVLSDTVSCDVGVRNRGTTYLITNFRKVSVGIDGGISLIGSLSGFVAAVLFVVFTAIIFNILDFRFILIATCFAFGGNLLDSYLGALLQNKGKIDNEEVNFLSVSIILITSLLWLNHA